MRHGTRDTGPHATMLRMLLSLMAVALCPLSPTIAFAQQAPAAAGAKADPDWPCIQRKVLALSSTQLWDGPDISGLTGWQDDKGVREMAALLQDRRVPMEDAAARLDAFVAATPEADRDTRLTLLFAALLDSINRDRVIVIAGIERFERRQKELAASIEGQNAGLVALRGKASGSGPKDDATDQALRSAEDRYKWDVRVFTERQQSIPYACDIPVMIEQRAFDAAREIRSRMTS